MTANVKKEEDDDYEIPEPKTVKRDGEAAAALLLLHSKDKKNDKVANGHSKIKPDPDASTSNGHSSGKKKKRDDYDSEEDTKKKKKKQKVKSEDEDSDYEADSGDEKPKKSKRSASKSAKKSKKAESESEEEYRDEDSEEEYGRSKKKSKASSSKKPAAKNGKAPAKKVKEEKEEKPSTSKKKVKTESPAASQSPSKKKKKEEEEEIWKWWEDPEHQNDEIKWRTLSHRGPVFAPPYEPLPKEVHFKYDGKTVRLSKNAEEVAGFYSRFIEHEYSTKDVFNKNFFKDWKKTMTKEERELITDLSKCDFTQINTYFKEQSEKRKGRSKEEKQVEKEEKEKEIEEYGYCIIDGHRERIGNYKIEPPGLFRGRGEHPKMGMLKQRIQPEDVIINCSKGNEPKAPPGHKWKEIRHDNKVTWLACWTENILGSNKYVMLNPSSKLKGQKDMKKYEVARKLKAQIDQIRETYRADWKSKEMKVRQRAVALYFIDKLALRAGNEKEEGETADTVGCCSLRVEHLKLHEEIDGKKYVVDFDFLGKDSIRYQNRVSVEKRVFKNLKLFMENKQKEDDVFDRLNTSVLNKHLSELMEGLTAKVFRTYNASITLQEQLEKLTEEKDLVAGKMLSYNRANRAVAILCNHQRSVPKTFDKQMENVKIKMKAAEERVSEAKKNLKEVKKSDSKNKKAIETAQNKLDKAKEALHKIEIAATDKEENKTIALGTSKLNYLDPRISVAWCKKNGVPIEKVYNKTQRAKFRWAIDMAGPDFVF